MNSDSEREAIVAFIRKRQLDLAKQPRKPACTQEEWDRKVFMLYANIGLLADAIENGDHLEPKT